MRNIAKTIASNSSIANSFIEAPFQRKIPIVNVLLNCFSFVLVLMMVLKRALKIISAGLLLATSMNVFAAPLTPVPGAPPIAARGYILQDYQSGAVLAAMNADQRMEPASLTKLMTAYLVFDELRLGKIKMSDKVTISETAWRMEGSRTFTQVGTQASVEDLLKGMIVQSGNDATMALAEHVAGTETVFATLMNHRAQQLGMSNSHFVNSAGMPAAKHYTTARDLATLTRALIHEFPQYYKLYSLREFTFNGIAQPNRNLLLARDSTVDGVKTGHTESAGFCLVSSALRDGMRLISVVLGTNSENARATQSQTLLNYGFRFYETHRLYAANKPLSTVRVWKGEAENLGLGLSKDLYLTIPRGQYKSLAASMSVSPRIMAPVIQGQSYGVVKVVLEGKEVATQPLVALQAIKEGGLWRRFVDWVLLFLE